MLQYLLLLRLIPPTLGVTVGGTFGDSVASMGDLDNQDLVIGSRTDTGGGSVRIMNTDGSPKSSVLIDSTFTISANDWFGNAVANIGDLDGDGITDMAVGALITEAKTVVHYI